LGSKKIEKLAIKISDINVKFSITTDCIDEFDIAECS
jgi:hypothetical protein